MVKPELEALAAEYPDRFQLHYTVDRPPPGWKYSSGFITKEMIAKYLFIPNGTSTQIYMCGPPPMTKVGFPFCSNTGSQAVCCALLISHFPCDYHL